MQKLVHVKEIQTKDLLDFGQPTGKLLLYAYIYNQERLVDTI